MPYTDITIFPTGTIGLCCSDALERTNYGNVGDKNLWEIWASPEYRKLRIIIGKDRDKYKFCKGCDFFDAGIRNDFIRQKLENAK